MGLLLSDSDSKSVSDVTALARFWSPATAAEGRRVLFDRGRLKGLNNATIRESRVMNQCRSFQDSSVNQLLGKPITYW